MKFDPTQVRKDIQYTDIVGKPKTGYDINQLIKAIESFLNWENFDDAFLVGAGVLGQAILSYKAFKNYGLNFVAAFDISEDKIGQKFFDIEVLPLNKLQNLAKRMHVHVGVITTPAQAAQEVADIMISSGIIAIWNFAPVSLKVPDDIVVENIQFSQSLAVLSRKLASHKLHI
jgi:redox-sensing transcriptional repressor